MSPFILIACLLVCVHTAVYKDHITLSDYEVCLLSLRTIGCSAKPRFTVLFDNVCVLVSLQPMQIHDGMGLELYYN